MRKITEPHHPKQFPAAGTKGKMTRRGVDFALLRSIHLQRLGVCVNTAGEIRNDESF
jgi:hypothetical protein